MLEINIKQLLRFLNKINDTKGVCWEWCGTKSTDGYGMFFLNKKMRSAHRISYELFKDDIPQGLVIDHLCRNRKCVNPNHLDIVTNQENCIRGLTGKINNHNKRKTQCPKGHKLEGDNLLPHILKNYGFRQCKTCHYQRESNSRKKKRGLKNLT